MTQLNFDATNVEPQAAFDPIPSDKYVAAVTNSELKPTKAGNGSFLQLEFTILDGEYKGRKLWDRLNINNPSSQATDIARSQLSAICRAVGIMQVRDSNELHHRPLQITVRVKQDDSGEMYNVIKGYSKHESSVQQPTVPPTTAASPTNYNTPPW